MASIEVDGTDQSPSVFRYMHPYGKYGVYLYVCRHPQCSFISEAKTTMQHHQSAAKHAKNEEKLDDTASVNIFGVKF